MTQLIVVLCVNFDKSLQTEQNICHAYVFLPTADFNDACKFHHTCATSKIAKIIEFSHKKGNEMQLVHEICETTKFHSYVLHFGSCIVYIDTES